MPATAPLESLLLESGGDASAMGRVYGEYGRRE
jgi:hypothetical protein